jgi:hypothetical protein
MKMFETKQKYYVVAAQMNQPTLNLKNAIVTTAGIADTDDKVTEIGVKMLAGIEAETGERDWYIISIGRL